MFFVMCSTNDGVFIGTKNLYISLTVAIFSVFQLISVGFSAYKYILNKAFTKHLKVSCSILAKLDVKYRTILVFLT